MKISRKDSGSPGPSEGGGSLPSFPVKAAVCLFREFTEFLRGIGVARDGM